MGSTIWKLACLVVSISAVLARVDRDNQPHKVVCYWGTWAYYRPGNGKFRAEDINPNICTHVNYGFAKLQNNEIKLYDPDLDDGDTDWHSGLPWGRGMIHRLNNLRNYNPHLSTLISIGGWNEGSDKYSQMVRDPNSRKVFVDSVVKFLDHYDFDGLDLDWEYPAMKASGEADRTPGRAEDKEDYISLLKELHEALHPRGYLLTAAVSAGKPTIDRAYDIPAMNKYLDFINLMTYDFHGGWDNKTAHNAPLYPYPDATGIDKEFTVSYAVDYWLEKGASPSKLILGLALYGRTFTLAGKSFGMGAPVTGKGGAPGPITRIIGMLGYNEICGMVKNGWQVHRDDVQKIPYIVKANQWVGYDDHQSLMDKLEYLKSKNLGGGMVWSIDTDDFGGQCTGVKYPLLKTISKFLNNVDGPDVIVPVPHVTQTPTEPSNRPTQPAPTRFTRPEPTTTESSADGFHCTKVGFFKDPHSSRKFHECVDVGSSLKDFVFECPAGTEYDENLHVCR